MSEPGKTELPESGEVPRAPNLWSLIARMSRPSTPPPLAPRRLDSRSRFIGDVIFSPVHGRVAAINRTAVSITVETPVCAPHAILAPVCGTLVFIDTTSGTLQNGVFTTESGREAILTLHILCAKSQFMIQMMIVAKPHGATSRIRMPLATNATLRAGEVIGYAGRVFETRLLLPSTAYIGTRLRDSVHGRRTAMATICRPVEPDDSITRLTPRGSPLCEVYTC